MLPTLVHALLLTTTAASAPVIGAPRDVSGVERGWDAGTQWGAVVGGVLGVVVIPAAIVVAVDIDDIKQNRVDPAVLVFADAVLTVTGCEVFGAAGAVVGALTAGTIGASAGAVGIVDAGPPDTSFDDVQRMFSGSTRRSAAPPRPALPAPPPPLAADPADRAD